ncbi:hypothetical protein TD95_003444 [Thielaviopsis punctulata]|uniref:Uncharacterized protein n=1 Tax=Thielaviopsis punctulata TaxID=72032 RepID=A0A0F4ZGZ5_9PEZI|nr:hypothetical protein TD95_003444 [Thielaviopsis punctulata]
MSIASSSSSSSSSISHFKVSRSLPPVFTLRAFVALTSVFVYSQASFALPSTPLQSREETRNTDKDLLPAQIGGIVGSYAISLVLVASVLLALTKRRRERLAAFDEPEDYLDNPFTKYYEQQFGERYPAPFPEFFPLTPRNHPGNPVILSLRTQGLGLAPPSQFDSPQSSYASHTPQTPSAVTSQTYVQPWGSPVSSKQTLGVDLAVDQSVVAADKEMANKQLEEMYSHVFEHEDAMRRGVAPPPLPVQYASLQTSLSHVASSDLKSQASMKSRSKPGALDLSEATQSVEKQSKTSRFIQLLSPRSSKKVPKGLSISSPILTPQSATFPREMHDSSNIPYRAYAPTAPPPVPAIPSAHLPVRPANDLPLRAATEQVETAGASTNPPTPDLSPVSQQSIDERLGNMGKAVSPVESANGDIPASMTTTAEPTSTSSHAAPIGLPSSPRSPTGSFPALPASPRANKFPQATANSSALSLPQSPRANTSFSRPNAPSAVRTDGLLPLRSYQNAVNTPRTIAQTTKQTTFERTAPFSPLGARTPGTSVPYSPYQPTSPLYPVTPSLVTKEDRKRMKRFAPKTPITEMAQSTDEIW